MAAGREGLSSALAGGWAVDEELLAAATASLQAQERLSSLLRSRTETNLSAEKGDSKNCVKSLL